MLNAKLVECVVVFGGSLMVISCLVDRLFLLLGFFFYGDWDGSVIALNKKAKTSIAYLYN